MNSLILESIKLATRALKKNMVRTILSVLGTSIGITSIVVIISAGDSLKKSFDQQLTAFGTDYIEVEIKVPNTSQASAGNAGGIVQGISITTLSHEDKESIDQVDNIKESYGAVIGQATVSSLYNEKQYSYYAVSHEFDRIDPTEVLYGRFFTKEEENSLAKVVVLGTDVATKLFPNQNPIGQRVKIQRQSFRVIGVYEERGAVAIINMDEWLYLPLETAQKLLLGFDHLAAIFAQMEDTTQDVATAAEITRVVRENHEIFDPDDDDFAVVTQREATEMVGVIFSGITIVLTIIASIALIVGGVGIMNIMYVAVNERVFEIGLRMAVGANARRIRMQFLIESIVITLFGGITGIIGGIALIFVIFFAASYRGFEWPLSISAASIIIGIGFSSLLGVFFGYFPAKKASELSPIEALNQQNS